MWGGIDVREVSNAFIHMACDHIRMMSHSADFFDSPTTSELLTPSAYRTRMGLGLVLYKVLRTDRATQAHPAQPLVHNISLIATIYETTPCDCLTHHWST